MAIEVVRATYTEQTALEKFFTDLFGWGNTEVLVSTHCGYLKRIHI
jgi:hypothetical protein